MLTNATLALFILFMKPMQCLVYVVVYEYQAVWHTNVDNDDRGSSLYMLLTLRMMWTMQSVDSA